MPMPDANESPMASAGKNMTIPGLAKRRAGSRGT